MFAELDVALTGSELDKAISELSLSRSAGPDGVLNEFLIYGRDIFYNFLIRYLTLVISLMLGVKVMLFPCIKKVH